MATIVWRELFYHAFAFMFFAYTNSKATFIPGLSDTYGGRYKFLTVINLFVMMTYYALAVILDLTYMLWSKVNSESKVNRIKFRKNCDRRDYVFTSIVFPLSCTVTILFWGIYSVSPGFIVTPKMLKYSPLHGFYNHGVHTAPLLFSLMECFITKRRLPISYAKGCLGWISFFVGYLAWILWIAHAADIWVYPFLKVMSNGVRLLFYVGVFLFESLLYQAGAKITQRYWRIECDHYKAM